MSSNQNLGRDELAAMLGASHASDLLASAGTDLSKKGATGATGGVGRKHGKSGVDADEDVSTMDRAQAAALVARKFAGGGGGAATGGGATRHRATGKRKRMMQHHLLAGDLMEGGVNSVETQEEDVVDGYYNQKGAEEEEEGFAIRVADATSAGRRKKAEAKVLVKKGDDGRRGRRRHHGSSSSSESDSESSATSSSNGSSQRRRRNNRERRSRSNSSSSSSSEDEADIRRRKAREQRAQRKDKNEGVVISSSGHGLNGKKPPVKERIDKVKQQKHNEDDMSVDENIKKESQSSNQPQQKEVSLHKNRHNGSDRRSGRRSRTDSSSSSGSGSSSSSDSSSSSSDDSSSSNESLDKNASLPTSVSKPLFVPKSKRGTVAEVEAQQQKHEEAEKRRAAEAEKRAIQSRALVAEAVSAAGGKGGASSNNDNEGDEFDTGEAGGEYIPVPDDTDPAEEDSPEKCLAERDAWEVRELIRILRDVDEALEREKERKELERRRALTDGERLEEDRRSGRYRAPGEERRRQRDRDEKNNTYLQRYHHRGAFYMDEDTLANAGEDDVRHRAAEYSRAATGEDKVDKSALPEVMQVKKFGFAGYGTKYKGLAKEDTTDKQLDFLPVRGSSSGAGRGRGRRGR